MGSINLHLVCQEKRTTTKWLHKIEKEDTPGCHCQSGTIGGKWRKKRIGEWQTRHLRGREKRKGDVGVEKEREKKEKKGEKMENFFLFDI